MFNMFSLSCREKDEDRVDLDAEEEEHFDVIDKRQIYNILFLSGCSRQNLLALVYPADCCSQEDFQLTGCGVH